MSRRLAFLILWPLSITTLVSCSDDPNMGYSTACMYRTDVRSVFVPIWQRGANVYRRELEMRLTESIQKRILLDTPYKVMDRAHADSELRGTIEEISQHVLSKNPDTGQVREMEITMIVSFVWMDLRGSGKVLAQRENFRVTSRYYPADPLHEDFFLGSQDLMDRSAKLIVEVMERPW